MKTQWHSEKMTAKSKKGDGRFEGIVLALVGMALALSGCFWWHRPGHVRSPGHVGSPVYVSPGHHGQRGHHRGHR